MRRFATTDWHGRYDIYQEVKKFLQPDDIVYFLGDAIDRGPDSWKLAMAIYNDPQFVYLKGNHEDMFAKSFQPDTKPRRFENYCLSFENTLLFWFDNGGETTFNSFREMEKEDQVLWRERINDLPYMVTIEDSACGEDYLP